MLSNMATSLILEKRIETTLAKAKALRVYVEPLINRSKEDTTNNRRVVFSYLHSKMAIIELVDYNENMLKPIAEKKAKSTRRSRAKKAETAEAPVAAEAPAVEETPKAE